MNNNWCEQAIQKINAALDVLNFSYRVIDQIGIPGCKQLFAKTLDINQFVSVKGEELDEVRSHQILHNQLMSSVGSLVIVLDEALTDVFENRNHVADPYTNDLRDVIFMLRCAFAHGPCEPKWKVDKEKYRRCVRLFMQEAYGAESKEFMEFDFAVLDGQRVQSDHFYGL